MPHYLTTALVALGLTASAVSVTSQPAVGAVAAAPASALYQQARTAARQNNVPAALRLLKRAVATGYYSPETLQEEPDFAGLRTLSAWPRVLAQARTRQQRHEAQFDQPLLALIRQIGHQDQQFRRVAAEADRTYGPDSPQLRAAMQQQSTLDSRLIRQVDSLITVHGYPGKSLVGEYQQSVAFLVIQHNPDEKYLPLLTAAADKGELRWSSLALLIDRLRVEKGEKQLYGSQLGPAVNGQYQLQPIEDEPNVNTRRAKIGMEPLEDYLKRWSISYQVPTASLNPNPLTLYVAPRPVVEEEKSPVELIGGYEALYAQLQYPAAARQQHITGRVTLELRIDKQGIPQDVTVVKSLGGGCDEEALRVMRAARFLNHAGEDHEIRVSLPFPYEKEK
ncbi:energy transducer TonB [Hymenobacter sp. BT18]|uniref:energy transducer TonB n=1 Tax=Hymenobacter sp. BT18 TaxID=2835648 RepID=UPI00143E9C4E|nr:energy transducer TonB [Hymenobacter sp. BT18]QIX62655.1 energy transducer TonB [Hymenobacter sp. BT18]